LLTPIIVVAQGSKQVNLGPTSFMYDASRFLLTAVDLPIVSWVAAATEEVPCLVLSLKLDMSIVRELLGREEIHFADAIWKSRDVGDHAGIPERMLPTIGPAGQPSGHSFPERPNSTGDHLSHSAGTRGNALARSSNTWRSKPQTAKAIAWITASYAKPLRVEELAQLAGMGVSTLHHDFRMLTSMTPLQYQKQLRLQSARSLMLNNGLDAARAAFEVGYESPTQFSREYSRFFGQPPMRDIRTLLSPGTPKVELVGSL
jgi:AraC-like DNA-binding protein